MYRFIFILAILFVSCAPMVKIPEQDIIINGDIPTASNLVINLMTSEGYILRKQNPLVFEKVIPDFWVSLMYVTKIDPNPIYRVTFTFVDVQGKTKVILTFEAVSNSHSPFERVTLLKNEKSLNLLKEKLIKGI